MASPCIFTFGAPTYLRFDLTPISGATNTFTPTNGTFSSLPFSFRFCAPVPGVECPGPLPSSSMRVDSASGTCLQSYGVSTAASALSLADGGGLELTYRGGPAGAFSTFTLRCDAGLAAGLVEVESLDASLDGSGVAYVARAAAACGVEARPPPPLGVGWIAFIALALAAVAYFGGGALYNRRASGARGLEAVPHIRWLRAAWARVAGSGGGEDAEAQYAAVGGKEEEGDRAPPGANVR